MPRPIEETKERFSLLLILEQMASSDDAENEHLSFLYECLAVAVDYKDFLGFIRLSTFSTLQRRLLEEVFEAATEDLRCKPQQVRFQLYGSYAEDLHVDVFPDFDVMIFPTADELMIDDELIEYCFPSNPLHVRVRGTGHPVLQSCLAENTEYVATSALKNFHPAIFGSIRTFNKAEDVVTSVFGPTPPRFFFPSVKNSMTSPAVKCTFDVPNICRKLPNEFVHLLYEHLKGGEESSISTFSLSEDETESFLEHKYDSFFSETKFLFDQIPAFRCLTWPMVAQEWRKRQRKWPSPDVVDKVIREGFHLVVKAPKNGGNPECDFRISFSHAEYLLSQEINEIQRECYRCLKTYHRVYLSTEQKGLISFHLKNIFLRTIEETGGEMWVESRRAECMSKLFANLLKALRERHLPHYFVRSYNLFGIDYIEDPVILESLTERVEQIMENPVKFAEELILVTPVQEQEQMNSPSNQLQSELMLLSSLKKEDTERGGRQRTWEVYLGTVMDLIEATYNADCILENLDPMERTVVEDLREIQKERPSIVRPVMLIFLIPRFVSSCVQDGWNLSDINLRHSVLAYLKQMIEIFKYVLRLSEAAVGPVDYWKLVEKILNPASENPIDWNLVLPLGHDLKKHVRELLLTRVKCFLQGFFGVVNNSKDDIPLD